MRIGLVVPHVFMQATILPNVIFSPGHLALALAEQLAQMGHQVTLYTPGPVNTSVANKTADIAFFSQFIETQKTDFLKLLAARPLTFVTLARQIQSELIARAYADANRGSLDVVHIYTNEEDLALPFAALCIQPVVFTHHDPFNLTANYQNVFPKYRQLNWLSISFAQRLTMPLNTNWIGNIYHGMVAHAYVPEVDNSDPYVAYFGRIIHAKGVHLAIQAIKLYNRTAEQPLKLKIAGKHYADSSSDSYWHKHIAPEIRDKIEYVGFLKNDADKQKFLGGATGLVIPSTFDEPFGMVMIEALACGTPLLGLDSGALPEIITPTVGVIVPKVLQKSIAHRQQKLDETATIKRLAAAIPKLRHIDRQLCRRLFEERFTIEKMASDHVAAYQRLLTKSQAGL
ncbi:MAG: glycosyltransferase family 4 protein [Candidatus Saccharimonadales bacterium]